MEQFDSFWSLYPLRVNKKAARKAFDKLAGQVTITELLAAVGRYKSYLAANPWLSPAHPATWLNGERWTDEYNQAEQWSAADRWAHTVAKMRQMQ